MKNNPDGIITARSRRALLLGGVAAVGVAVADFCLPAYKPSVLYVLPILLASQSLSAAIIVAITALVSGLTVFTAVRVLPGTPNPVPGTAFLLAAFWITAAFRVRQIREEQKRREWAAVSSSSRDPVITMDLANRITEWNTAAVDLYGYTRTEAVGTDIDTLLKTSGRKVASGTGNIRSGKVEKTFQSRQVAADGTVIVAALTLSPIHESAGSLIGVAASVRDVTLQMRAQEALQAREDQQRRRVETLQDVVGNKDTYIMMLGHEFRNPLSAIGNALGVLQAVAVSDEQREKAMAIIDRQLKIMARLLNDLGDYSHVSRGDFRLERRPTRISHVVRLSLEGIGEQFRASDKTLEVKPLDPDMVVDADPIRLGQVLRNLLDNARKYTGDGGNVSLYAEGDESDVKIHVTDDGIGIEPEHLPLIFEEFQQPEQPLSRTNVGLGLGLAIAKRIVEAHGGNIRAFSEGRDTGTEVIVTLPRSSGAADEPSDDTAPELASAAGTAKKRVLVADDNVEALHALADFLELNGCEVEQKIDGLAVLRQLDGEVPDAMILDIGLPGADGFEIAARVRQSHRHRGCTLIAVTGYGSTQIADRAAASGFDYFLVKPVDLKALLDKLQ